MPRRCFFRFPIDGNLSLQKKNQLTTRLHFDFRIVAKHTVSPNILYLENTALNRKVNSIHHNMKNTVFLKKMYPITGEQKRAYNKKYKSKFTQEEINKYQRERYQARKEAKEGNTIKNVIDEINPIIQ